MRFPGPVVALVLLAGCSHPVGEQAQPQPNRAPPSSGVVSTAPPTTAPAPGSPVADLIGWIEAGNQVDAVDYHTATRDGTVTDLGENVAFTTPSRTSTCMTDTKNSGGALACLVQLTNPPPRPQDAYGHWVGGWVDFDGTTITVGGIHGDPGRFVQGDGPQLGYGDSLRFADYQCRSDPAGLYCVNYAHHSAVRFSAAGIEPFGCTRQATLPADIGVQFTC